MKPSAILRHFLCIASGTLLCISYVHAADVTWDITPGTVSLGDTLGTANTYSGDISISTGSISLNNGNAIQNSAVSVASGTSLLFSTGGDDDLQHRESIYRWNR
jgi:hypothetical protein